MGSGMTGRAVSGVERVVAAGVLACNPHNTQSWRLGVGSEVIQIRSDPSRRMPINDASDREHFAGLGCAIENMMIAASAAGLGPSLELLPEGSASDHGRHDHVTWLRYTVDCGCSAR